MGSQKRRKNTILEKENRRLQNEVKNQQAVIEMLITGDRSRNEWKVVKNDTNKTSDYSMPFKGPSTVNLQNLFSSLMVA